MMAMDSYLFISVLVILFGIIGFLYPELGGRTWGTTHEVKNDPEKVVSRTISRNRFWSIVITLMGLLLFYFSI